MASPKNKENEKPRYLSSKYKQNLYQEELDNSSQLMIAETVSALENVYQKSRNNLYCEIGEIIINKIFQDSPEDAKTFLSKGYDVKKLDSVREVNRAKLMKTLRAELIKKSAVGKKIGKTMFYNSIRLVVEAKEFEKIEGYKDLTVSHKIELLSVKDQERKIELIETIVKEKLSVHNLRELTRSQKKGGHYYSSQKIYKRLIYHRKIEDVMAIKDEILAEYFGRREILDHILEQAEKLQDDAKKFQELHAYLAEELSYVDYNEQDEIVEPHDDQDEIEILQDDQTEVEKV